MATDQSALPLAFHGYMTYWEESSRYLTSKEEDGKTLEPYILHCERIVAGKMRLVKIKPGR